jgi:protein TonB
MNTRSYHWLGGFVVAVALHLTLVLWFYAPETGAVAIGAGGIEIDLGVAGGAAGEAVPESLEAERIDATIPEDVTESMLDQVETEETHVAVEPIKETQPVAKPESKPKPQAKRKPKPEKKVVRKAQKQPQQSAEKSQKTAPAEKKPALSGNQSKAGDQAKKQAGSGKAHAAGGNPAAQRNYFAQLAAWLNKHKRYPRRAQQRRQEGTVKVRFMIDRSGRVLSHRIIGSSGHALLDREVEAMLARASPLPPVPAEIGQTRLSITLPVAFSLR